MSNNWEIPLSTESIVLERDQKCVYCGISFQKVNPIRKEKPSWEHIINDIRITGPDNMALCCISCNASKGTKTLEEWFQSQFCKNKGITKDSVAEIVKDALKNPPTIDE